MRAVPSRKFALASGVEAEIVPSPEVISLRATGGKLPEGAVYIGRPSIWGNPFEIGKDGSRREVIAAYTDWLARQPGLIARARRELKDKSLACWCAPAACHGDVLLRLARGEPLPEVEFDPQLGFDL